MIEKPIASGISASATTVPERTSARMFESQSRRKRVGHVATSLVITLNSP